MKIIGIIVILAFIAEEVTSDQCIDQKECVGVNDNMCKQFEGLEKTCPIVCGGPACKDPSKCTDINLTSDLCKLQPIKNDCPLTCAPVHCQWRSWEEGVCSSECGDGTRNDTRTKLVEEANGGTCDGKPIKTEHCKSKECPVHCEWSIWKNGTCTEKCGGGIRKDTRTVVTTAKHNGTECDGATETNVSCNTEECQEVSNLIPSNTHIQENQFPDTATRIAMLTKADCMAFQACKDFNVDNETCKSGDYGMTSCAGERPIRYLIKGCCYPTLENLNDKRLQDHHEYVWCCKGQIENQATTTT